MKKILFFASLFFVVSCTERQVVPIANPSTTTPTVIDLEKEILDEIKLQPEITAKVVEPLPFKKIGMDASFDRGYYYDLGYQQDGKIKSIKANGKDFISIDYNSNQVVINRGTTAQQYELGSDNLIKNTVDGNEKFYYKNGYLLRNLAEVIPLFKSFLSMNILVTLLFLSNS